MVGTGQFSRRGGRWLAALASCGAALALANGPAGVVAVASSTISGSQSFGAASASTAATATGSTVTAPHIMVIVEENQEYGRIIGSSSAPYINSLANAYTSATNWYAVEHNSPTDYLDLISGSDQGLGRTTYKQPPFSATNLVDELYSAHIPWQAYMESMSSNCEKGGSNGLYDPNHNPFRYFSSYQSYCTSGSGEGVVPYPGSSGLVAALDGSSAPDFVFISPNDCNDMHGSTSGTPCAGDSSSQLISAGDTWLQDNLAPVLSSTWFQNNGVVILTWDEGTSRQGLAGGSPPDDGSCTSPYVPECGGHIPTIVITPNAAGSFTSGGDHYGMLRGIEEAYGVGELGHSSGTNDGDLEPAFGLGGSTSGAVGGTVTDATAPGNPPISGATVACACGGTLTATTDSLGDYTFTQVAPGTGYGLTFSATGYTTETTGAVSVTAGATTDVNEALPETGGVVSGTVTDATAPGNPPISGATVTCACGGTPTATTDSLGGYTFTQVTPGTGYTVSVAASGYISGSSGSFAVTGGQATTGVNVSLTPSAVTLGVAQSFGAANATAGTTLSASTGSATTGGDLLVAVIRDRNPAPAATVTSVTDPAGNTWLRATLASKGQADEEIWYSAGARSVTAVTVTLSGSSALAFTVIDVTGASSAPLDVTASATGSGTAASTGTTGTTAAAAEIAVADIGWNAGVTPSAQTAGYTTQTGVEQATVSGDAAGEQAAWQVLSSTSAQSYAATLSASVAWTGAIATFRAA